MSSGQKIIRPSFKNNDNSAEGVEMILMIWDYSSDIKTAKNVNENKLDSSQSRVPNIVVGEIQDLQVDYFLNWLLEPDAESTRLAQL